MSIQAMQHCFGSEDIMFAYPYGYAEPEMAAIAKSAGIICGLTAKRELVMPRTDLFAWGRFIAEQYDTAATLAAKLSGWYSTIYNYFAVQGIFVRIPLHGSSCINTETKPKMEGIEIQ